MDGDRREVAETLDGAFMLSVVTPSLAIETTSYVA